MVVSLQRDLEDQRKIIFEAIIGQQGLPVGLAYPDMPVNYIHKLNLQLLAAADYVVVLLGRNYGAVSDQGVGQVHALYASAQAARKPVFSLIYEADSAAEEDSYDHKRLQGLIENLQQWPTYRWHDADSLRDCTELAIEAIYESNPAAGWVKADQSLSNLHKAPQDQRLISALQEEITQLKDQLQRYQQSADEQAMSCEQPVEPWNFDYRCNMFREGQLKQLTGQLTQTLDRVFAWLAPTLLSPTTEARIQGVIALNLHDTVFAIAQSKWVGCHAVSDIKVTQVSFNHLKLRMRALNLVMFDSKGRWQLTKAGEQLALARA